MAELENAAKAETKKTGTKTEKTLTYICKTKCFFDGSIYKVGDVLTVASTVKLPPYFEVKA